MTEDAKPTTDASLGVCPGADAGGQPRRWTLPRAAEFWILAGLFLMLFFASAAASPLYLADRTIQFTNTKHVACPS